MPQRFCTLLIFQMYDEVHVSLRFYNCRVTVLCLWAVLQLFWSKFLLFPLPTTTAKFEASVDGEQRNNIVVLFLTVNHPLATGRSFYKVCLLSPEICSPTSKKVPTQCVFPSEQGCSLWSHGWILHLHDSHRWFFLKQDFFSRKAGDIKRLPKRGGC